MRDHAISRPIKWSLSLAHSFLVTELGHGETLGGTTFQWVSIQAGLLTLGWHFPRDTKEVFEVVRLLVLLLINNIKQHLKNTETDISLN